MLDAKEWKKKGAMEPRTALVGFFLVSFTALFGVTDNSAFEQSET